MGGGGSGGWGCGRGWLGGGRGCVLCAASSPVACACSFRCCICGRPGGQRWSLFRVPSLAVMCDFFFFLCVCAGGHTRPCRAPTGAQSSPVVACNPWVVRGGVIWSCHCSIFVVFSCHPLPRHGQAARAEPRAPLVAPPPHVRCRVALVFAAVRALCLLPCACHVPPHPAASVSQALVPPPPAAIRRSTPRRRRRRQVVRGDGGGAPSRPPLLSADVQHCSRRGGGGRA